MSSSIRRILPLVLILALAPAHAQFMKSHGVSVSVGATGQFTTPLTATSTTGNYNVPFQSGSTTYAESISNQQQFTTDSAGFLTSLDMHPVAWAGVEFNYSFTHYSERYSFNYSSTSALQQVQVPVDVHEATAAYSFHPRHIPFQPFLNIGGGALDFAPGVASNQWRAAGLAEFGFDLPVHYRHIGFRVEGRSLYYRAPNFYQPAISTRSWRVTAEPSISTYYRF